MLGFFIILAQVSKPPYGGVTVYEGLDLEKATEAYNKILNS